MKPTKKQKPPTLETIQDPGEAFVVTINLRRSKTSVRGERDYRRTLKAVITACEHRLGPYRRSKA